MDAVQIPDAVRRLGEHPIVELPVPPSMERIERDGAVIVVTPFPTPQMIEPVDLPLDRVEAAVEAMRAIGRGRGKSVLGWWVLPENDRYAPHLEALGLVSEDLAGYEAVENVMALVTPPAEPGNGGVQVRQVESFDDYTAGVRVGFEAFEFPRALRDDIEAGLPARFAEYQDPRNPGRDFVALVAGRIVGSASAIAAHAGVALFGGGVLPEARRRGVYQALLHARWKFAVARGTPALTVQAGRMSRPVLARFGFVQLAVARIFFDPL
jgi:GNAT superfamily N-acetyltransferase